TRVKRRDGQLSKYRRIEINAYHRKVTVVSGEWPHGDLFEPTPMPSEDQVSLNDTDSCEPVEPDSPEGQLILVQALHSLESRLSPETREELTQVRTRQVTTPNRFVLWLRSTNFLGRLRSDT